jgi:hypothetical protein
VPQASDLGEDDAERLVPLDGHDHGARFAQHLVLLRVVDRADIFDAVAADPWLDLVAPVVALMAGLGMVAGDDQAMPRAPCDLDRPMRALDALDAAQEAERRIRRNGRAEF